MTAPTKRRLYSPSAKTDVRAPRNAPDAPVSGLWTPDNRNAGELGPDVVILDAREWLSVRLIADFRGPTGAPVDGGSVDVLPMVATPDAAAPLGRRWKTLTSVGGLTGLAASAQVPVDGHLVAFRITAYVAAGATDVVLCATGGAPMPRDAV
jgi:hypothetical protein